MVSSISTTRRSSSTGGPLSTTKSTVTRTPTSWDPSDDKLLRHLKEIQKLGWKEIASNFTNRTPNACQFRWRRLKSGSLKSLGYTQSNGPLSPLDNSGTGPIDSQEDADTAILGSQTRTPTPMLLGLKKNNNSQGSSTTTTPPPSHELIQQRRSSSTSNSCSGMGSSAIVSDSSSSSPEGYNMMSRDPSPKTCTSSPSVIADNKATGTRPNWSHFKGGHKMLKKDSSSHGGNVDDSDSSFDDGDSSEEHMNATQGSKFLNVSKSEWSSEEDDLLSHIRQSRSLSFTELSILLPTKSEHEIRSRIDQLAAVSSRSNSISLVRSRANSSVLIEPYFLSKSNAVGSSTGLTSPSTSQIRSKRNSISKLINPYPLPLALPKSTRSQSISTPSRPHFQNTYSTSSAAGVSSLNTPTSIYSSSPSASSFLSHDFIRSRSLSFSMSSGSLISSNANSSYSNERGSGTNGSSYRKDSISNLSANINGEFQRRKSSIFGIENMLQMNNNGSTSTIADLDDENVIEDD